MGRDMQHSKNEAVKKAPCINAGDLTPSELREWIIHLANNAEIAGLATEHTLLKLQSAEHSLSSVLKDLEPRISFLVSDQIIHSEDHSSAIQEELATLNKVVGAIQGAQKAILSACSLLQQADCRGHLQAD